MGQTFDINRFWKYLKFDLRRALSSYGVSALLIAFLPFILYIIYSLFKLAQDGPWEGPGLAFRASMSVFALFLLTCSMPSTVYGHITDRRKGSDFLMIPSSTLEKYISMLLVTLVIFPLLSGALFLLWDKLICMVDPTCGRALLSYFPLVPESDDVSLVGGGMPIALLSLCGWLLFFLLGALVFSRRKISMTVLTLIGINIIMGLLGLILFDYMSSRELIESMSTYVEDPSHAEFLINLVMHICLDIPVILLAIAVWLRLRKLQH